jgi:hypothetical protein
LLTCCRIAVGDALAMARVMLPAPAGTDIGTIVVAVDVCRPVGIDVHVVAAAMPTPHARPLIRAPPVG